MSNARRLLIGTAVIGAAALLSYLMRPIPPTVEVATVQQRPFVLTVEDQGRTRARNPFIVASPIGGRLLRPELDEGDKVQQGQVIARIALQPQDQRTLAMEQANLAAAEARLRAEQATLVEAQGTQARADRELERRQELLKNRLASVEEVEAYQQAVIAAQARVRSIEAAVEASRAAGQHFGRYRLRQLRRHTGAGRWHGLAGAGRK